LPNFLRRMEFFSLSLRSATTHPTVLYTNHLNKNFRPRTIGLSFLVSRHFSASAGTYMDGAQPWAFLPNHLGKRN
jgi:hypothetical protein